MTSATQGDNRCWPRVYLFGDSLTQFGFGYDGCWIALLADHLQRTCDVFNRGFSGYNSRWLKLLMPQVFTAAEAKETAAVAIFVGANDSNDGSLNPRQHVPLAEFKQNLKDMVEYLQSTGVPREKVILISPPACFEEAWEEECKTKGRPMAKSNKVTGDYAKACVEAATEAGAQCVDFYTEMMKSGEQEWEENLSDGLHLSSQGSTFLFDLLQPVIDNLTASLPMKFPPWDDIDFKNPEASFAPEEKKDGS